MATDPNDINKREPGWRQRVRPSDVPIPTGPAPLNAGVVTRAPLPQQARTAAAAAAAAAADNAKGLDELFADNTVPSMPARVPEPTFVPPPTQRVDTLSRRTAARDGLTRVVKTAGGVYTDAPDAVGEERLYDAMGNRADVDANAALDTLARRDGVGRSTPRQFYDALNTGRFKRDDADILAQGRVAQATRGEIDARLAAQAAAQAEDRAMQLTGERGETATDILKAQSEAAKNIAAAGKTQAETDRIGVETNIADADRMDRSSDRLNAKAAEVQATVAKLFADDPDYAARRWGDVDPQTAMNLEVMKQLIDRRIDPRQTDIGGAGYSALASLMNEIASGKRSNVIERLLFDGDFAYSETPVNADPEQFEFDSNWLSGGERPRYRFVAPGADPVTYTPEGESLQRENLEPMLQALRRFGQPRQ